MPQTPTDQPTRTPRQRQPELEHDHARAPSLGYESPAEVGWIHCLAHGFPTSLARWHFHDEYELHLITATAGKAFVGDWIGPFEAGHLVLCGPRLPHNWISVDLPEGGVAERDLVIQFSHEPIAQAADLIPELADRAAAARTRAPRHRVLRPGAGRRGQLAARQARPGPAALRRLLRAAGPAGRLHRLPAAVERADAGRGQRRRPRPHQRASSTASPSDIASPLSAAELAAELRHEREPVLALLPARHRQHLHRLRQPHPRQPRLPAADGYRPPGHAHLLRGRLPERGQLQPPLSRDQGHDADGVPPAGRRTASAAAPERAHVPRHRPRHLRAEAPAARRPPPRRRRRRPGAARCRARSRCGASRRPRTGGRRSTRRCRTCARRTAARWPACARSACRARCTAPCCWTATTGCCARPSCGTTAAARRSAPSSTRPCRTLHAVTGNLAMPGFTAPKLAWVRQHEPACLRPHARVCCCPRTGCAAADRRGASATCPTRRAPCGSTSAGATGRTTACAPAA